MLRRQRAISPWEWMGGYELTTAARVVSGMEPWHHSSLLYDIEDGKKFTQLTGVPGTGCSLAVTREVIESSGGSILGQRAVAAPSHTHTKKILA